MDLPTISRGALVIDDDQLTIDGDSKPQILESSHPEVGPHTIARFNLVPPALRLRCMERHSRPQEGNQPAAGLEPEQGLLDMPCAESRAMPFDTPAGC